MTPFPKLTLAALCEARLGPPDLVQQTKDFRAVFLGTAQGTRVLASIMSASGWLGVMAPTSGAQDVPIMAAFNEGRRSLAQEIAAVIDRPTDKPPEVDDGRRDADYRD